MSKRYPKAKWVLPDVIDPPERLCFQIEVPNDKQHIAAFRGALLNLASAINWQDDPDHTAKDVAKVWDEIYQKVTACAVTKQTPEITLEDDMSDQIRLDPDNNCILQIRCCGEWVTLIDVSKCVPSGIAQPTDGTPPAAGDCKTWQVALDGNGKWLLPDAVNEGDTIIIELADGAWNDGTPQWNCVDGRIFFAGFCTTDDAADSGDPLPTANHMRLVMNVDGVWVDAYNATYAVQVGVTDGAVYFQANDGTLNDNTGRVSFVVHHCAKQDVVTPIGITYPSSLGVGPSSCNSGDIITITAVNNPPPTNNWYISAEFSREVKVTVLSATGYVLGSFSGGTVFGQELNASSGVLQQLIVGTNTTPTQYTPQTHVKHWDAGGATGVWSVTLKVEDF